MKDPNWVRIDSRPGSKFATWRHVTGWTVQHCGHPTALWPWLVWSPEGVAYIAPNMRGFRHVGDAKACAVADGVGGVAVHLVGKGAERMTKREVAARRKAA